jgi:hypothetical protein
MKSFRLKFLIAVAAVTCMVAWLFFQGLATTKRIQAADIQHQAGVAYSVRINLGWPLRYRSDSDISPTASPTILHEDQQKLGPAHSESNVVESVGRGAYSHSGEQLVFSASDNTDPRANGRTYATELRLYARPSFFLLMFGLLGVGLILCIPILSVLCAVLSALRLGGKLFLNLPGVRWSAENVLPGVVVSAILIALIVAAGEVYIRTTAPPFVVNWPTRFGPQYGWTFAPGETVSWSNNIDFRTATKVNSLGFLDREPPKDEYPSLGVCRVAFIGDSFVEAAQIPIKQKVQSQLEKFRSSGKPFETLAFGYSGTGQVNQLPFYDAFASRFHPNVVVLVFVGNDFANNSSPLESVRNGWDPLHPPRLFFERAASGEFRPILIDPDWTQKTFKQSSQAANWHTATHGYLLAHSSLYKWLYTRLSLRYPAVARWLDAQVPYNSTLAGRMSEVSKRWPGGLSGWNFPDDWDMDTMFFADHLPPVFQEAVEITGHALDEYSKRGRRDGFNLVILADKSLYMQGNNPGTTDAEKANPLSATGQIDRLRELARSRNIPIVDFRAYIESIHEDPLKASFAHDGHWSPSGHQWAAQALNEYFRGHPEVCERPLQATSR